MKAIATKLLLFLSAVFASATVATPAAAMTPRAAILASLNDLDQQAVEDAVFYRYLYLPDDNAVPNFNIALRLHVNLISREAAMAFPKIIGDGLWRVDLRDYQWNPKVWERLALIDPYFHRRQVIDLIVKEEVTKEVETPYGVYDANGKFYQTEVRKEVKKQIVERRIKKTKNQLFVPLGAGQLASLSALTGSDAPIVRADWFLVQSARQISLNNRTDTGVGYYDWLELRTRDDYFKLVGVHLDQAVRIQSEIRAVIGESGVSAQGRQITRDGAINGGHWTTLEVFDESGRGIPINNLRRNELLHNAEEHYAPLANGLPVTFLSDDKGARQDTVPDKIGGNRSNLNTSNDLRVHVNISCLQCHAGQVLMPFDDDVRLIYTGRLSVLSGDKSVALELKRQYGTVLNRVLGRDRDEFQGAYTAATRKSAIEAATLYSEAFNKYAYGRINSRTAAQEYGVLSTQLEKSFKQAFDRIGRGDFRLDAFLVEGTQRTISRLTFEDAFIDGQDLLYGVLHME